MNSDQWEFSHPNFRRGWFDLLKDIKRRKTASKEEKRSEMTRQHREDTVASLLAMDGGTDVRKVENLVHDKDALIAEVIKLRKMQDATQRMLAATLNELHETRCEQQRTQDTVEKVVSFLSSVVEGQANFGKGLASKRLDLPDELREAAQLDRSKRPKLAISDARERVLPAVPTFDMGAGVAVPLSVPLSVMHPSSSAWMPGATPAVSSISTPQFRAPIGIEQPTATVPYVSSGSEHAPPLV